MKKHRRLLFVLAMALCVTMLAGLLSACGGGGSSSAAGGGASTGGNASSGGAASGGGVSGEPYRIAMIGPLTGDGAQYGQAYKATLEILRDKTNEEGGINGRPLEVDFYDDKKDPKETLNAANMVVADGGYVAVIGSQTSSCSMAAAPVLQKAQIPMISPQASHPDFAVIGDYIFSFTMPLSYELVKTADFLYDELGFRNMAVLYSNDDWGLQMHDLIKARFEERGGKFVAAESFVVGQTKDFSPLISKCKEANPDSIFPMCLYNEGILIVQQMKQQDLDVPIFTANTLMKQEVLDVLGEDANGITFLNPFDIVNTTPDYDFIEEAYEAKTNQPIDPYVTQSYDALAVLINAMREHGDDRAAIRDYVAATKNYAGVSGTFTLDANGTPRKNLYAITIENGEFVQWPDFVDEADLEADV